MKGENCMANLKEMCIRDRVNDHLVNGNVVTEYTIGANAIGAK